MITSDLTFELTSHPAAGAVVTNTVAQNDIRAEQDKMMQRARLSTPPGNWPKTACTEPTTKLVFNFSNKYTPDYSGPKKGWRVGKESAGWLTTLQAEQARRRSTRDEQKPPNLLSSFIPTINPLQSATL